MAVDELNIQMPYGEMVAYHCQRCGSPFDINKGKCDYCGNRSYLRFEPQLIRPYIELDDDKKFYFNQITEIEGSSLDNEVIDATSLSDISTHYIVAPPSLTIDMNAVFTDDTVFKVKYIHEQKKKYFRLYFDVGKKKVCSVKCFDIKESEAEITSDGVGKIKLSFGIEEFDGWVDGLPTPKGARCPNCGAVLFKNYGLCDYCGGWVEYR